MDINKYINSFSNIKLQKNHKILLMVVYAVIMFIAIQAQMNLISFILLFAVLPVGIYFFVRKIFPKED